MKFSTLMVTKAVVCIGFAPLLLFFPGPLLGLFGAAFGSGAALTAREYGAALVGNFLLTWLARNTEDSVARRAIIIGLFAYDAVALVACLFLQFSGVLNLLGWGVVAIYLFFTVCFGYFMMPRRGVA
jgi:hypothetical protein